MGDAEDLLKPGEVIGPYRVEARVGRGGMGEVWKAVEDGLDRHVALKVMASALAGDPEYVKRFRNEARAAAALVHPNIVNVFGVGEVRGLPYIAMEYVDGKSVHQLIQEQKRIPAATAVDWMIQTARGLEAASKKGVIHRDIKPHNLMVDRDGVVKVADFGLAKLTRSDVELTRTGVAMGTPLYMSPEQGRGDPLDWRSDLYSLGATIYHTIAGQPPFTADTPLQVLSRHAMTPLTPLSSVNPGIPEALSAVITKMMAKVPSERHATYGALIADLERLRGALSKSAPAAGAPAPAGDAEAAFGKAALDAGVLTAAQLQGARGLQAKMKAAGKPARSLEEILLAAKLLTGEQVAAVKKVMSVRDSDDDSGGNLEVTDVHSQKAAPAERGQICILCRLEVRPNQVQTACPECGMVQHGECLTSFGGCGNEACSRSPKSMAVAVQRGRKDDEPRGAAVGGGGGIPGLVKLSAVAAVLALGVLGVMKLTAQSAQDFFDEAKTLEGERKGRMSIFSIDEANKDVAGATGLTGEQQRTLEKQVSLYRKALEKDPAFKLARVELASCLMRLGRSPEALIEFEAILQADPTEKTALLGAGTIRLKDGDLARAEEMLKRAAESGMVEAWLSLAVIYQDHKKKYAESVAPLRKYTAERAEDGTAWARLALALMQTGNEAEAVAAADTATRLGSDSPMGAIVRATAAFRAGRFEEAAAAAVAAADKLTHNGELEFSMRKVAGLSYWKAGRPAPAREQLAGARNLNPADVEVRVGSAELAVLTGDWVDAGVQFKEAFDRGSGKPEHLWKAGFYRYTSGDGGPAAAIFEELSRHQPDYPDLQEWLARAYLRAGALESADPAVERAIQEKPDSPTRIACVVWVLSLKAQLDQAAQVGEEAVVKHPDCGFLRYRLAEAYRLLRKAEQMAGHLQAGAELGDEECLWANAEHVYTMGNKEATLKAYQAYLDKFPAGTLAQRARQMILNLTSTGTTGSTNPLTPHNPGNPSTGVTSAAETLLARLNALVNRPYDPAVEAVDAVYAAMLAATAHGFAAGDRIADVNQLNASTGRAERYVIDGLASLRDAAPNILADARNRRIRDRFAELATLSDQFVAAWGSVARKINPAISGRVDEAVTRWPTTAPKDPYAKVSQAFEVVTRLMAAAVGDIAAGEILARLDAHILICDNTIQICVARLHALCSLTILGLRNPEALQDAFHDADDKADSGIAQIRIALTKLAEYADQRRAGR
ncbi:MAG: protein kinase [Candidatus Brocadiae bacterium]|nr:protein kinase [Candidatus Brocadiia bacterium]